MLIDSVVHMTIKWPFWKLLGLFIVGVYLSIKLGAVGIDTASLDTLLGLILLFLPFYGIYRFNKYFQVTQTLFGDD